MLFLSVRNGTMPPSPGIPRKSNPQDILNCGSHYRPIEIVRLGTITVQVPDREKRWGRKKTPPVQICTAGPP